MPSNDSTETGRPCGTCGGRGKVPASLVPVDDRIYGIDQPAPCPDCEEDETDASLERVLTAVDEIAERLRCGSGNSADRLRGEWMRDILTPYISALHRTLAKTERSGEYTADLMGAWQNRALEAEAKLKEAEAERDRLRDRLRLTDELVSALTGLVHSWRKGDNNYRLDAAQRRVRKARRALTEEGEPCTTCDDSGLLPKTEDSPPGYDGLDPCPDCERGEAVARRRASKRA